MKHRSALVTAAVLTATIIGGGTVMALNGGLFDDGTKSNVGTLSPTLAVNTVAAPTIPSSIAGPADQIPAAPAAAATRDDHDKNDDDHDKNDDDKKDDDHDKKGHDENDDDHNTYDGHDDDD